MDKVKRAVIYDRISQDREGTGLGVKRHTADCEAYAERMGMHVVASLDDNNVSGFKGKRRQAFDKVSRMVAAGEVDVLVAWKMDRLGRNQLEFWTLAAAAEEAGVEIHLAADGGLLDLQSASGGLTAGMMVTVARFESATKRDRAYSKARQKVQAGEWLGGARPFGWGVQDGALVVNDREAEALRTACADLLAGRSLGSVIRGWNDEGRAGGPLRTSLGKGWTYASLRQVLLRERNTGRFTVNVGKGSSQTTHVAECPPLVSEQMFRDVRALLTDPSRRRSQSNKARHLLSGIAQCQCGELVRTATATGKKGNRFVYRCPVKGPGHVGKSVAYVDTVAELFVFQLLARDAEEQATDPARVARLAELDAQLGALQRREDEAGAALGRGELSLGQLASFNREITAQRDAVNREREELGAAPAVPLDDPLSAVLAIRGENETFGAWRRQPIDDRRDFIRSRLHVVLRPHDRGSSRTFDTDTVSVYSRTVAERGRTLTKAEVVGRPLTPLVSGVKLLPPEVQSYEETLFWFLRRSGQGWPHLDKSGGAYPDTRATFTPHWKKLVSRPAD